MGSGEQTGGNTSRTVVEKGPRPSAERAGQGEVFKFVKGVNQAGSKKRIGGEDGKKESANRGRSLVKVGLAGNRETKKQEDGKKMWNQKKCALKVGRRKQ